MGGSDNRREAAAAKGSDRIGRYEIRSRIGSGGQGAVYRAYDPHLDIDVALKVLHADVDSADFVERFKMEAQTMVRLTHANIVRVYDYNPSHPYIIMEYCDGGDLTEVIKRREPLPLSRIVEIITQVLAGVDAAHGQPHPVLHRDLKPGNVLFHRGVAKVADFGLAKVLGTDSNLTQTRSLMGTVRYTSPEQCEDPSRVDHRTDLWSVGVLLCELLSWERPFDLPGEGFMSVAMAIANKAPRPPAPELPAPLWELILRALSKNREDRFSSAHEFAQSLATAAHDVDPSGERLFPAEAAQHECDHAARKAAELLDAGKLDEAEAWVSRIPSSGGDSTLARYWQQRLSEKNAVSDGEDTIQVSQAGASTAARAARVSDSSKAPSQTAQTTGSSWLLPGLTAFALLAAMAAALFLTPSTFFGQTAAVTYPTTLLTPAGKVSITRATRDDAPVPSLEGILSAENPRQADLAPGAYRLEWGTGQQLQFDVPADPTIVLVDGLSEQIESLLNTSEAESGGAGEPQP